MTGQNNHQPDKDESMGAKAPSPPTEEQKANKPAPSPPPPPSAKQHQAPADPIGIGQAIGTPMTKVQKFNDPETMSVLDKAARTQKWLVAVVYNCEGKLYCHVKRSGLTCDPGTDGESDVDKALKLIGENGANLRAKPKAPEPTVEAHCEDKKPELGVPL